MLPISVLSLISTLINVSVKTVENILSLKVPKILRRLEHMQVGA